MPEYLSAVPAYGRDYRNKAAVLAAWEAGNDFLVQDFRKEGYINKEDKPAGVTLNVRYDKLRKVCVIK